MSNSATRGSPTTGTSSPTKNPGVYIQRVFDGGNATRGYRFDDLHESCKKGTPFFMMMRTTPKIVGWEQTNESKPWYTKSGRLEFYRDEDEFIEYGENMPLHREPVDGTMYEPGVLMATPHPLIEPAQPSEYGLDIDDLSVEVRQVRHVVRTPDEIVASQAPAPRRRLSPCARHPEVPPRLPLDGCFDRHRRVDLRPVRRLLPPRQTQAVDLGGLRRPQPRRCRRAWA